MGHELHISDWSTSKQDRSISGLQCLFCLFQFSVFVCCWKMCLQQGNMYLLCAPLTTRTLDLVTPTVQQVMNKIWKLRRGAAAGAVPSSSRHGAASLWGRFSTKRDGERSSVCQSNAHRCALGHTGISSQHWFTHTHTQFLTCTPHPPKKSRRSLKHSQTLHKTVPTATRPHHLTQCDWWNSSVSDERPDCQAQHFTSHISPKEEFSLQNVKR